MRDDNALHGKSECRRRWSAWLHPTLRPAAPRAFRCRSLPLAAAFLFAMTDIPRPYANMQADELADEITVCRECIQTTRDLRLRKQMQVKLAELIAEENRRFTEGLPF